MDELRARAYLDLLLGKDSRPGTRTSPARPARHRRGFAGRVTLTVPLATLTSLAGPARRAVRARPHRSLAGPRPGHRRRAEPEDDLVRDGHRPGRPRHRPRLRPARTQEPQETRRTRAAGRGGFSFTPASRDGPPGGYGTWRLHTPGPGPDLIITLDPLTTQDCDHRFESRGHDPGSSCGTCPRSGTPPAPAPICRRPASQCDFEHNTPYEAGGRTCLCNGGPQCKR